MASSSSHHHRHLAFWCIFAVLLLRSTISAHQITSGTEAESKHSIRKAKSKTTTKCSESDLLVEQKQVSRGQHPRWRMVVKSNCSACEATIVELNCPGWIEPKAIEGYMYPVEMVAPDLCMVGAPVTTSTPFSYVYRLPHPHSPPINLTIASVKYTCNTSHHHNFASAPAPY